MKENKRTKRKEKKKRTIWNSIQSVGVERKTLFWRRAKIERIKKASEEENKFGERLREKQIEREIKKM